MARTVQDTKLNSRSARLRLKERRESYFRSISDGLAMKGVPMAVIATQLGHGDTRVTERHYAHLAPSYVADTVRAAFSYMGIVKRSKVLKITA